MFVLLVFIYSGGQGVTLGSSYAPGLILEQISYESEMRHAVMMCWKSFQIHAGRSRVQGQLQDLRKSKLQ